MSIPMELLPMVQLPTRAKPMATIPRLLASTISSSRAIPHGRSRARGAIPSGRTSLCAAVSETASSAI